MKEKSEEIYYMGNSKEILNDIIQIFNKTAKAINILGNGWSSYNRFVNQFDDALLEWKKTIKNFYEEEKLSLLKKQYNPYLEIKQKYIHLINEYLNDFCDDESDFIYKIFKDGEISGHILHKVNQKMRGEGFIIKDSKIDVFRDWVIEVYDQNIDFTFYVTGKFEKVERENNDGSKRNFHHLDPWYPPK